MLVSIPWQAELKLHPETLALLQAASRRVGRNLYLYNADSAWRSYARQEALWVAYQAGGNVASDPDTGQRSHMRGAAFDLRDTSAAVQAACVAVGLKRDPAESWHWNHPNWANMPIIFSAVQPKAIRRTVVTLFYCTTTDKPSVSGSPQPVQEWAVGGDSPGTSANWITTKDPAVSAMFAAQHNAAGGKWVHLSRAEYTVMRDRYLEPLKVAGASVSLPSTITGQFTATL